mmetsp:Transcript_26071/g.39459  ORF Transcript_26071/g.39459 Transcript_26071/m.39459 type:complete len:371 (-) Transcript_26071:310-1422(-)
MVSYQNNTISLDGEDFKSIPVFRQDEHDCLEGHSPFEILLGKEKAIFNHAGNKRFRAIINHNVDLYINANSKSGKSKLVRMIYADMKKAGFRVRKRADNFWCDIKDVDAREKLSHALRDRVREIRRSANRQKESSEGVFPMIISMAKVLNENQKLLNQVIQPMGMKSEYSKVPFPTTMPKNGLPAMTKTCSADSHCFMDSNKFISPNSILDMIGSIPTNTKNSDLLSGIKRTLPGTSNSALPEERSFKRRRGMSFATETFEEANIPQMDPSMIQPMQYASSGYEPAENNDCCQGDEDLYSIDPLPIMENLIATPLEDFSHQKGNIKADVFDIDDCFSACSSSSDEDDDLSLSDGVRGRLSSYFGANAMAA